MCDLFGQVSGGVNEAEIMILGSFERQLLCASESLVCKKKVHCRHMGICSSVCVWCVCLCMPRVDVSL